MRQIASILILIGQALLVGMVMVALRRGWLPRGVPGEWEWPRLPPNITATALELGLASLGILLYGGFVALGMKSLERRSGRSRAESLWLTGLCLAAIAVQLVAQAGAPYGYGLTKWAFALYQPGSSGYYTIAKQQIRDLSSFLAAYPDWIKTQDALHIGTHPPGLFVTSSLALKAMEARPDLAKAIVSHVPESVAAGFRELSRTDPVPVADQASLALTGLAILIFSALTVVPLYLLGRSALTAPTAWAAASLWPLIPSAILFQPTADTAFPFLSTTAIALASWSNRRLSTLMACLAGVMLGVGMFFTLAFLPVGLVVAIVLMGHPSWRGGLLKLIATGIGFMGFILALAMVLKFNPLAIWWTNQVNHARFYVEYPRHYLAWVITNPIETAIAIGLPTTIWGILGTTLSLKSIPRSTWAVLVVLICLNFGGRNLSEVARLWIPLMPALLLASGVGMTRVGGPWVLWATVTLLGFETLMLQTTVQVVYPF